MQYMIDHETLFTCYDVGCHVNISSIQTSLVPQALKATCKVDLDRL
jgi:hypothetical protein